MPVHDQQKTKRRMITCAACKTDKEPCCRALLCSLGARRSARSGHRPAGASGARTGLRLGSRDQTFADGLLAGGLAIAPDGLGLLAGLSLGGLLIGLPRLHFAEDPFALHLLLENPEGLIDVVVAYQNLQWMSSLYVGMLLRLGLR